MTITELRKKYHCRISDEIIRTTRDKKNGAYPNFADGSNKTSRDISWGIVHRLGCSENYESLKGQTTGGLFETITKDFLEEAVNLLQHLRTGKWEYSVKQTAISCFDQYEHLAHLEKVISQDRTLASAFGGDYLVKPDIVISRLPVPDEEVNRFGKIIDENDPSAKLTPLREVNYNKPHPILHASISCKWTIRSDRSQNTRTEALNLIRNRKGHLPHVVSVTAEPLPTRIAALALGTGDLDCVYHFALLELKEAIEEIDNQDQFDMLKTMIDCRRLRDISDLPFDLAI